MSALQTVVTTSFKKSATWLGKNKILGWNATTGQYVPYPLGKATTASGLKPQAALIVKKVPSPPLLAAQSLMHPAFSLQSLLALWRVGGCLDFRGYSGVAHAAQLTLV